MSCVSRKINFSNLILIAALKNPFPSFQTRPDGEETPVLRTLHRGLPLAQEDEVGPGLGAGVGQAHRRVHGDVRAGRSARVVARPRRDQRLHRGRYRRQRT